MDERAATGAPYVFAGLPSALAGPYDDIVLPERGAKHDWELELAAVIGRPARNLTRDNALDHVAGYTICNDVTTRDLVYRSDLKAIGSDWLAAKNAPNGNVVAQISYFSTEKAQPSGWMGNIAGVFSGQFADDCK